MQERPKQETHYGKKVWVNPTLECRRRCECLCLNCENLDSCHIAKAFYQICVQENVALAVSRCPLWKQKL